MLIRVCGCVARSKPIHPLVCTLEKHGTSLLASHYIAQEPLSITSLLDSPFPSPLPCLLHASWSPCHTTTDVCQGLKHLSFFIMARFSTFEGSRQHALYAIPWPWKVGRSSRSSRCCGFRQYHAGPWQGLEGKWSH